MEYKQYSLLYPDSKYPETKSLFLDEKAMEHLEFKSLTRQFKYLGSTEESTDYLRDIMTNDPDSLLYRHEIVKDILENPTLFSKLDSLMPIIKELLNIANSRIENSYETLARLTCMSELTSFLNCLNELYQILKETEPKLCSKGLKNYLTLLQNLINDQHIIELKEQAKEFSNIMQKPKSVTIGINLNDTFQPYEAGVISFNTTPYRSGKLVDKLLRGEIKSDTYDCIDVLAPMGYSHTNPETAGLYSAVIRSLSKVMDKTLGGITKTARDYIALSVHFLPSVKELAFYINSVKLIQSLKDSGMNFTRPEIATSDDETIITGLYNVVFALNLEPNDRAKVIVRNQLTFDKKGRIFVITGPNSGGKTMFLKACGLLFAFYHLGLYVPAQFAKIKGVTSILTMFTEREAGGYTEGRFEEECKQVKAILEKANSDSLILLNEPFNSTGFDEAYYVGSNILKKLSKLGARALFVTHVHSLSKDTEIFNREIGHISVIDSLNAGVNVDGTRNYIITREKTDGRSHIQGILNKVGLSF